MAYQFGIMNQLMADIRRECDDKAVTHARAKTLLKLVQKLITETQPGAGEFKWTAAARKVLTISADGKNQNPGLFVARECDDVWHGDGCYIVNAEPSKRFEPCDYRGMAVSTVKAVIPAGDLPIVTIVGSYNGNADEVEFSNGTVVNRTYLAYVTATVGGDVTYKNNGDIYPVLVQRDGVTYGLLMPIRKK